MEGIAIDPRQTLAPRVVIVYHSVYGNTRLVAEAIAEGLAPAATARLLAAHGRLDVDLARTDLLVLGVATQRHGMAERARMFVERLERQRPARLKVAIFDTRYRMPRVLAGSAGHEAEGRLRRAGCEILLPTESFFVERLGRAKAANGHQLERLEPGQLDRAREWARSLGLALRHGGQSAA